MSPAHVKLKEIDELLELETKFEQRADASDYTPEKKRFEELAKLANDCWKFEAYKLARNEGLIDE